MEQKLKVYNLAGQLYKFLIITLLLSCSDAKIQTNINPMFIQKLMENRIDVERGWLPSITPQYLFAKGDNDSILLIEDYRILEEIYDSGSYEISYKDFLTLTLNQKIILKPQFFVSKFQINQEIAARYHVKNFDDFFDTYCKKTSYENGYHLRNDMSENERYAIIYYLFINNFITSFDDYFGTYSVEVITDYIQNK